MIRDTSKYLPLMHRPESGAKPLSRSLRDLALEHLGHTIQAGEHDPAEDARAALALYLTFAQVSVVARTASHLLACVIQGLVIVQAYKVPGDGRCWLSHGAGNGMQEDVVAQHQLLWFQARKKGLY